MWLWAVLIQYTPIIVFTVDQNKCLDYKKFNFEACDFHSTFINFLKKVLASSP